MSTQHTQPVQCYSALMLSIEIAKTEGCIYADSALAELSAFTGREFRFELDRRAASPSYKIVRV